MFNLQKAFNDGYYLHQFCRPPDVVGDIVQDSDNKVAPHPSLPLGLSALSS